MDTKGVQLGYFILYVYSDVLILPRFEFCLDRKVYFTTWNLYFYVW